jgi:hypothetical protein
LSGGSWSGPVFLADGATSFYNMTLIARGLGLTTAAVLHAQAVGSVEVSGGFETGSRLTGTVAGVLDGTLQRGFFRGTLTSDAPPCVRSYSGPITESGLGWVPTGEVPAGCPLTFVLLLTRERGPQCAYRPSLSRQSFPGQGGTGHMEVDVEETCVWMAESLVPWIQVSEPGPWVGSGTAAFTVALNAQGERTGEVRIANSNQVLAVQQGPVCTFTVSPSRYSMAAAGGSGQIVLTAPAGCQWMAQSATSWLTVTPTEGVGSATISFSALPNAGASREGTFTVGGQTITVMQGLACGFGITATPTRYAAAGGSGTITVTAPPGCAWTASTTETWITFAPPTGNGNGVINVQVAPNQLPSSRQGTVNIGGQSATISQDALSCSYTLGASQTSFPRTGGKGVATVTATAGCQWAASANQTWVTVVPPASGVGNGQFAYVVDPVLSTCSPQVSRPAEIALTAFGQRVVAFTIDQAC